MIKRVNRKKHLFPRFDDFKEAAKLTYDLCVSLFCGYFVSAFAFSRGFFLNELLYLLSGMILFIPLTKNCFLNVCVRFFIIIIIFI